MIQIRPGRERGYADHGWLKSFHSFSFADYHDPAHMGYGALRVINEDRVAPGTGFGTHGHRDMEMISYVLEGALAHQDSTGGGGVITPGEVQRMSAGTGVRHSEMNGSKSEGVHFLQIWLEPDRPGVTPSYEQKKFDLAQQKGLQLVASPDGANGSVKINADAKLHAARLGDGEAASLAVPDGRHAYVHVARGEVKVNGQALGAGDGAAISKETKVALEGVKGAEVLVFDLA